jgi:Fe-S cluster assembly protein SufD
MNAVAATHSALAKLRPALTGLPGGAAWDAARAVAFEKLLELGLPTPRDEAWKYTNLRLLERRDLAPAPSRPVDAAALAALLPPLPGPALVFVDGRHAPSLSGGGLPAGVAWVPLATLIGVHGPAALADRLPPATDAVDDRIRLLNDVFLADGAHLAIDTGAQVAAPLTLVHVATGGGSYPRVVVDVGANASATLVEVRVTLGDVEAFAAPVTEIRIAAGAALEHYRVQLAGARSIVLDDTLVRIARDARYAQSQHAFGAQLGRTDIRVRLEAPGACAQLHGLFMVDGTRQLDTRTLVEHVGPHTRSEQVYRGVAGGRGRGTYDGKIVVHAGATKSESQQSNRNLLLSRQAEIDSRPQLEIYTDDVQCGHGATTGALDENMLFYLLSRGIDRATARGLLTFAFAEDVVSQVRLPELRRFLEGRVIGGLPDAHLIREFV